MRLRRVRAAKTVDEDREAKLEDISPAAFSACFAEWHLDRMLWGPSCAACVISPVYLDDAARRREFEAVLFASNGTP